MANELKIVIDADVQNAVNGLKQIDKAFNQTASDAAKFGANVTQGTQKATAALAKIPSTSNSASFALTNLGRVAQDLPFGFLGIANNITPLIESFQRLSVSAKESGSTLGKELLASLRGGGGLILGFSLLSAAMSFVSVGLSAFTRGFGSAGKAAGDAAREIKTFSQVSADAFDNSAGDIAKVRALVKAATDTGTSLQIQKRAIEELKTVNKSYFGDLEAGKSTFEKITKAADDYTQALIQQAIVKGLQEEISELSKQMRASEKAVRIASEAVDEAQANFDKFGKTTKGVAASTVAGNTEAVKYRSALKATSAQLASATENAGKLQDQFNELTKAIQAQIGVSLKFKPLNGEGLKDETDKIIARARQFAKEFGESFVVPNLDDSFFKTKTQLLNQSKKLLDDVKRFVEGDQKALKIRIPVQPEIEFLPEQQFSITQDQIDNFFKSLRLENKVPIEVVPDISLSKESIDKINKKLDLRQQFSILGKSGLKEFEKIFKNIANTDFTKMNEGIAKATKTLQGMMEIANTLNQAIGQGLVGAFNAVFDSILEGKNVFKALGNALKDLIVQTIKAIAQMLILKFVTSLIFPGAGGAGSIGKIFGSGFAGGGFGQANLGGGFGGIGSSAFSNVIQIVGESRIDGNSIVISYNRASGSQGR